MEPDGQQKAKIKKTKNQFRREKAKQKKLLSNGGFAPSETVEKPAAAEATEPVIDSVTGVPSSVIDDSSIEIDNIPEYYRSLFEKFSVVESEQDRSNLNLNASGEQIFFSDDDSDKDPADGVSPEKDVSGVKNKSRKKIKSSLAELKARVANPELIEWYDADAPDPELVAAIKSIPGIVPVPQHWQLKREYLSSRRGIMKAPFDLPDYIKATGIMEMRDSLKEDDQNLAQKSRERVQPKMGRLDIDYQKLHDAIFRFQTKPNLYHIGEVYYENKESEIDLHMYRPGKLSKRLKSALSIPPGAPPPWLLSMQRYGPPVSYQGLKIPGLNAPIPAGAQWGFQPGGYGRPPLDDNGKPLYGGDVYDTSEKRVVIASRHDHSEWGTMVDDYGAEEDDEGEEEEDEDANMNDGGSEDEGAGYVDEDAALAAETNIQEARDVRKAKRNRADFEDSELPANDEENNVDENEQDEEAPATVKATLKDKSMYQVLEPRQDSSGFLGSQSAYHIPTTSEFQKSLGNLMNEGKKRTREE